MRLPNLSVPLVLILAVLALAVATPAVEASPSDLTEADLRAFLDDFFERELEVHQVVGAGVVVVQDGRIVDARGYGYADLEAERPVVVDSTLFPAQSVSKLFAATAIMQLYERGLVDLDADVREYLGDVPLDSPFSEPVTLAHLLTHTAGFDDSYIGFLPREADDTISVPEFLTLYKRQAIFRPGTVHAYTNYGSLLGQTCGGDGDRDQVRGLPDRGDRAAAGHAPELRVAPRHRSGSTAWRPGIYPGVTEWSRPQKPGRDGLGSLPYPNRHGGVDRGRHGSFHDRSPRRWRHRRRSYSRTGDGEPDAPSAVRAEPRSARVDLRILRE